MGEDDWQTPATLAQDYFTRIHASSKEFVVIAHAEHMSILDQPTQFFDVLAEIKNIQSAMNAVSQ
jgi:pimeloyl-ACP methyl ester carboxylesterase